MKKLVAYYSRTGNTKSVAGKIAPAIRTFLVQNDFSDKQLALFVTLGGDKAEKALKNMKKVIAPNIPVDELGIINAMKNPDEIEKEIEDWCKIISKH